MKKKLTILFSIVCILVLAACGQTKANKEETKKSNEPKNRFYVYSLNE